MRKWMLLLAVFAMTAAGCSTETTAPDFRENPAAQTEEIGERDHGPSGRAVIANRGSGTISVIDAQTLEAEHFDLPASGDEAQPEPMYVVHNQRYHRVFVGDRANNRVVAFDDRSFAVEGMAPAGNGVFHMWGNLQGRQLWVNNDIDNTSSVINPGDLSVIATVPTPADLVGMGGKPHDVIIGPWGFTAYVSVLGLPGENDYVVQFNTWNFSEIARAAVGKDPHLSVARQHRWLYVPCQNSDQVVVLSRANLAEETVIEVPGAHGAAMSRNGEYFYTTNLPGGGADALYTISTRTNSVLGDPVDTPYPVPHNLALSNDGKQLFVTHSGAASDKVTVYRMHGHDPVPVYDGEVTVGLNPFGLAYVN